MLRPAPSISQAAAVGAKDEMDETVTLFSAALSKIDLSSHETSSHECKPQFDENYRRCRGPSHPEGYSSKTVPPWLTNSILQLVHWRRRTGDESLATHPGTIREERE